MKNYSYIVVFIYKLFFFYFLSLQAFAQENDGDILSPPQNIVPEILEEEIIDTEAASTNILNEVIIDDLKEKTFICVKPIPNDIKIRTIIV